MRTPVRSILSVVTLGVLATSYQIGQAATSATFASASAQGGTTTGTASSTPTESSSESTSAATPSASASATQSATATKKTTAATPSATPSKTSAATPTATTTPTATKTAASGSTQTSSLVQYRYGMVQLAVTKSNGKITDIGLVSASATSGRESAFSYLVDYAIQANGSGFGNLSGATYTVDAFKKALDSALAKF
ncbi:FMN-binding protein [Rhodoluna sp.]|uniref:FMN-binding protein n=1 Tax=Rhodoluna sp. TaxID=1969481 RepID=UPI0025ED632F|nr:FMN-binding protein [Rhodoluna sp.]